MSKSPQVKQTAGADDALGRVRAQRIAREDEQLARLKSLLGRAGGIVSQLREERRASAARLNLFDALGLGDDEASHSRILAFLLDPMAHHDQGSLFLASFLARFAPDCADQLISLESAFVTTEFTAGAERLDIVIFLPHSGVVCIENKTWSAEGNAQIARYQRYLATMTGGTKRLIFLTPEGRHSRSADEHGIAVRSLSYQDVAAWLQSPDLAVPGRLRAVLDMYADTCLKLYLRAREGARADVPS